MHRRDLTKAAYNPREIDDYKAKKLRDVLGRLGLVEPVIFNKRTGTLTGGHQRLTALDALDAHDGGTGNYLLDVSVIDKSLKQERETNIALNNPHLQGDFDLGKLLAMLGPAGDVRPEDVGYDQIILEEMFLGTEFEEAFRPPEPETIEDATSELQAMAETRRAEGKGEYEGAPVAADDEAPFGRTETGEAIRDPEKHAAVKEERERTRAKLNEINEARDTEYYAIVVLGSREEREALMPALGLTKNDKYINGRKLMHLLGVEPPPAPTGETDE